MLTTGFDVGGAHLKLAQLDAGRIVTTRQVPCALWQGLDRLDAALRQALDGLPPVGLAAVTMTGELADLFPDRMSGVEQIARHLHASLPCQSLRFWAGRYGFLDLQGALDYPLAVASANWLATATIAAARLPEALLLDIGSTTTDLLIVAGGEVLARGTTDRERLACEELVYTGAVRTPLMALATSAPFQGERVPLMNEHFATTADLWRILGLLPEDADQHGSADGGEKTVRGSRRRLARMIGADLEEAPSGQWQLLAEHLARRQEAVILAAIERQLSRGILSATAPILGAGSGAFIAQRLAARLERAYATFTSLIPSEPQAAAGIATCAPAVAVALLA